MFSFANLLGDSVKIVSIFHVSTWETSEDEDVLVVHLSDTYTLTLWEDLIRWFDQAPWTSHILIISLNCIDVFLSDISNTTEHENPSFFEWATSMVMATLIKTWHIEPKVNIDVVLFAFHVSILLLKSWSSNDKEFWA